MDDLNIGELEIGALSADELALARELMNSEVSGLDDELDIELDGVGEVEIGAGPQRKRITASRFKGLLQRAASRGKQAGMAQGIVAARASSRPAVRSTAPDTAETSIMGFVRDANDGGLVPAGATVDVESQVQDAFKPEALIVAANLADDFLIEDIKIGSKSLFVANKPVPASMFQSDALLGKMLIGKTGQVSQKVTLKVRNISVSARPFYAAMVGWRAS